MDLSQYIVEIAACPDNITIKAGLPSFTALFAHITDKFNNKYIAGCNTDADGVLVVPASICPDGTFNPHGGSFELRVFDYNHSGLMLTLGGHQYESVLISFVETLDPDGYENFIVQ